MRVTNKSEYFLNFQGILFRLGITHKLTDWKMIVFIITTKLF